jgi:hypothetical protein
MNRITRKELDYFVNELNLLTNNPLKPYEQIDGKLIGQIGNYHLYGAYGSTALHQTMNNGGGIKEIFGLSTKRELYNKIRALIQGIELGKAA